MSLRVPAIARPHHRAGGQSLVEFTLVFPILLILLLTVADFGRYFATGIQIESAAREAAELAAGEYLRAPAPIDYALVDGYAWRSVCNEASRLPNASPPATPGGQCDNIPTMVCVHDGADTQCGATFNDASGIPAQCSSFAPGNAPTNAQTGGSEGSKYVEVRVCYRFSAFLSMSIPFFGLSLTPLSGNFYIERTRMFTVADY